MTGILYRFRAGRFLWTLLVTLYFLVFFRNFMLNALPGRALLPTMFAFAFVLWLSVEYYFGSPFFQSGEVESSSWWRSLFAFFVYPYLAYVGADFIWWHRTQFPTPSPVGWVIGMVLFGAGTWARLETLSAMVRAISAGGQKPGTVSPVRDLARSRFFRMSRHPRYFATFLQLCGAALVFNSWGGLVLAVGLGLPMILVQVRHEDPELRKALKGDAKRYVGSVPLFWPRFRDSASGGDAGRS